MGTNPSLVSSGQMPMSIVITTESAFQPRRNGKKQHVVPMAEYILGGIGSPVRVLQTMVVSFVLRFVMSMLRSLNQLRVILRVEAPTAFTTWLVMHGSGLRKRDFEEDRGLVIRIPQSLVCSLQFGQEKSLGHTGADIFLGSVVLRMSVSHAGLGSQVLHRCPGEWGFPEQYCEVCI
jgi:hypothetical protein